jgi:hypothetical protein
LIRGSIQPGQTFAARSGGVAGPDQAQLPNGGAGRLGAYRAARAARDRALAALKVDPDATLTALAKAAGVSRSTVVNAREARRRA